MTTQGPPGAPGGPPIDPRLARPAPAPAVGHGVPAIDPRLARPPHPSAPPHPAPPPRAAPAPQPLEILDPPSFADLIASGALALVSPGETYGGLARRPEPSPADVALALLAWGGGAAALSIVFAVSKLNAGSWGVLPLAGGALAALILAAPAGLAAGAVLHALAVLSGGQHGYWRSAQAAAGLGAVPCLAVAALWAAPDPAWVAAPLLLGTWLAVCAVEKLHDAPAGQAWMVIGFVGALLSGSAVVAHDKVALALVRLENAATVLGNNPGAHAEQPMRSAAGLDVPTSAPAMPAASAGDRLTGQAGSAGPIEADPAAATAAAGSSLDYLRSGAAPDGEGPASPDAQAEDPQLRQAQAMQQNAAGLLQNLSKQLSKNSSSMPPEQAAQLQKMLEKFQKSIAGGGKPGAPGLSPADTQQLLQQVMGAMAQQKGGSQPASPPAPSGQRKRASPPPPAD